MNKILAAAFVPMLGLLGCSTPPPEPVLEVLSPPPPEVSVDLPLEEPVVGYACQLGKSCLELDPRPFEACLVGTKHCVDKATESVEVQGPRKPNDSGVVTAIHSREKQK